MERTKIRPLHTKIMVCKPLNLTVGRLNYTDEDQIADAISSANRMRMRMSLTSRNRRAR